VQQRLKNLGFSCGDENNEVGPRTRAALRSFQEKHGLQMTGEIDEPTKNRLREIYGS
jgi:peptidoglycan hydrolase-like protein with peptidoglycan-binding domain